MHILSRFKYKTPPTHVHPANYNQNLQVFAFLLLLLLLLLLSMKLIVVLLLLLLVSFLHLSSSSFSLSPADYNAIFNFGDSLSDTGNFLLSGARAFPSIAHLPYGTDFFGHPTGRSSNGRLIIDFIAQDLGLPFLPPFLAKNQSFVHGANFAVFGATALDASFFDERGLGRLLFTNHSLDVQLRWFERLIPSLCRTPRGCREFLSRSLFVVGEIGGNDYNYPLIAGLSTEEIRSYVPLVIEAISNAAERLIELGAVNLVVPGNPPGGCMALILTVAGSPADSDYEDDTGCLRTVNELVQHHNTLLELEVAKLRLKHPRVKMSFADFYQPIIQFVRYPNSYGFSNNPLEACCGAGGPYNCNVKVRCGEPGSSVCLQPWSSVDWDGLHLTEAAYRQIAQAWVHGPHAYPPIMSLGKDT